MVLLYILAYVATHNRGRSRLRRMSTGWRQDQVPTSASFTQVHLFFRPTRNFRRGLTDVIRHIDCYYRPVSHTPPSIGQEIRCFMSIEKTMMRTTRETHSAPRRETFIPPTLLPVCCACGIIRDDTRFSPGRELWITKRTYRETHGVNPSELARTHTSCPECFMKAQDTLKPNVRVN